MAKQMVHLYQMLQKEEPSFFKRPTIIARLEITALVASVLALLLQLEQLLALKLLEVLLLQEEEVVVHDLEFYLRYLEVEQVALQVGLYLILGLLLWQTEELQELVTYLQEGLQGLQGVEGLLLLKSQLLLVEEVLSLKTQLQWVSKVQVQALEFGQEVVDEPLDQLELSILAPEGVHFNLSVMHHFCCLIFLKEYLFILESHVRSLITNYYHPHHLNHLHFAIRLCLINSKNHRHHLHPIHQDRQIGRNLKIRSTYLSISLCTPPELKLQQQNGQLEHRHYLSQHV